MSTKKVLKTVLVILSVILTTAEHMESSEETSEFD